MAQDPRGYGTPSPVGNPTRSGNNIPEPPRIPDKYPRTLVPIPVNTRDVEAILLAIIRGDTFALQRFLFNTWNAERSAIKFEEIRNALRDGQINRAWLARWQRDYSRLVNDTLRPLWAATMEAGGRGVVQNFLLDLNTPNVLRWMDTRAGELIVGMNKQQHMAVRGVLQFFVSMPETPNPTVVGRYLRPIIGLTDAQELAVRRLRIRLVGQGLALPTIESQVRNYANRLIAWRAENIARTEYAFAFNYGNFEAMRQARDLGLVGPNIIKIWQTAEDEKVCPVCAPLNGQIVDLDETFPITGTTSFTPPAHPRCRCTLVFRVMTLK